MNLWRRRYRAWIVPYAEGTLDARRAATLEAWLAHDPVLAAEAEAERRIVARLRDAAQGVGMAPGDKDLWPGIAARLEPRRSLVRPLLLVGGLSAAATSLAWATLWGPLGHPAPAPRVVVVASGGIPDVIVVGPPSARRHGHPGRRPRHGAGHGSKAPAVVHAKPGGPPDSGPGGPQDDRLLARSEAAPVGESRDDAPTAPQFAPGDASRFHLAASVHPVGHNAARTAAPAASDDVSVSGNADAPGHDDAPANTGDGSAPAQDGVTDTATEAVPGQQASKRLLLTRRSQRHRRRHAHRAHPARTEADDQAPAEEPDATTAAGGADARTQAGRKPVE